jgi:hypothetical protein
MAEKAVRDVLVCVKTRIRNRACVGSLSAPRGEEAMCFYSDGCINFSRWISRQRSFDVCMAVERRVKKLCVAAEIGGLTLHEAASLRVHEERSSWEGACAEFQHETAMML